MRVVGGVEDSAEVLKNKEKSALLVAVAKEGALVEEALAAD